MDEIIICYHCGTKISMKYNAFPGSCTETEQYDCPKCKSHLFSRRDSGYYTLTVISEDVEPCDKITSHN